MYDERHCSCHASPLPESVLFSVYCNTHLKVVAVNTDRVDEFVRKDPMLSRLAVMMNWVTMKLRHKYRWLCKAPLVYIPVLYALIASSRRKLPYFDAGAKKGHGIPMRTTSLPLNQKSECLGFYTYSSQWPRKLS